MREDIFGGLRNAVENGDSVEEAVQSFINAGYPESEVLEASRKLNFSQIPGELPNSAPKKLSQDMIKATKPKKRFRLTLVSVLFIILILLVIFFIASLFFQEEISGFFSGFLSE